MKFTKPLIAISTLLTLIVILFVALGKTQHMTVVYESNTSLRPVEMSPGKFQCGECGMVINDLSFAAQVVAPNGKTWFFDDNGCMAAWLSARSFQESAIIWVNSLDTGGWIDGRRAFYSQTDNTPMSYGFGAYMGNTEIYIDFNTMQSYMLRGETLANPDYGKQLLGD
jgi:copper chaperone NosL